MSVTRFSNYSVANGFPKYQNFWDQSSALLVSSGLIMHLDAGNALSYPGSGSTWTDISGNSRNVSLNNATYTSLNGGGIVFNGTSTWGSYSMSGSGITSAYTIESVVKIGTLNSDSSGSTGFTYWTDGSGGHGLIKEVDIAPGKFRFAHRYPYGSGSNTDDFASAATPASNTMYHITYVRGGGTQKIYINGSENSSNNTVQGAFDSGLTQGSLGRLSQSASSRYLSGNYHQFRIYNRALSSSEVLQNFNSVKGKFGL